MIGHEKVSEKNNLKSYYTYYSWSLPEVYHASSTYEDVLSKQKNLGCKYQRSIILFLLFSIMDFKDSPVLKPWRFSTDF